MIFAHPITFFSRWAEVYQMHVAYTSAKTAERRKEKMDDVQKRSEYRKAHGIEPPEGVLGGWTAKSDAELTGPALREGGVVTEPVEASPVTNEVEDGTYVDFEGKRQPVKKKWFGVW
jgi:hypothetical protein